jgi:holo-[acyl-carrier protein] synthase
MILPVASPDRGEHQSSRPQGLILDKAYKTYATPTPDSIDTGVVRKIQVRTDVDVSGLDGQLCEISISHDGDFATAVAIVPSMGTGAASSTR